MRKVRSKTILTPKNGHDIILCSHKRISQKYEEGFDDDDIATPQSADVAVKYVGLHFVCFLRDLFEPRLAIFKVTYKRQRVPNGSLPICQRMVHGSSVAHNAATRA